MSNVKALEQQLSDAKILIEARDRAMRLAKNPDFKKLILDGFCSADAARLVQLSGDPALDPQQRADSLNMAQASGHLKRYLSMTIRQGNTAEDDVERVDEALAEARVEEDNAAADALLGVGQDYADDSGSVN